MAYVVSNYDAIRYQNRKLKGSMDPSTRKAKEGGEKDKYRDYMKDEQMEEGRAGRFDVNTLCTMQIRGL